MQSYDLLIIGVFDEWFNFGDEYCGIKRCDFSVYTL
jgi:hypothetical protein